VRRELRSEEHTSELQSRQYLYGDDGLGRRFETFLLAGVTGSGKSEVYLRAAEATLAMGRGAVILVPEIALVPALARAVRERFGDRLALLHSAMPPAERHQEWERIRSGEASVVVGPRSAVFAPVPDLGLLVVDEEHDESYKQDQVPRYQGGVEAAQTVVDRAQGGVLPIAGFGVGEEVFGEELTFDADAHGQGLGRGVRGARRGGPHRGGQQRQEEAEQTANRSRGAHGPILQRIPVRARRPGPEGFSSPGRRPSGAASRGSRRAPVRRAPRHPARRSP